MAKNASAAPTIKWFQNVAGLILGKRMAESINQAPSAALTIRPAFLPVRPASAAVTANIPTTQAFVRWADVCGHITAERKSQAPRSALINRAPITEEANADWPRGRGPGGLFREEARAD
jgi:hypothetical protein